MGYDSSTVNPAIAVRIASLLKSGMLKRTAVYTLSGMFAALVNFLLLPIFTKYLSRYDYGVIETILAIVGFLTGLFLLGSTTMLAKEYFTYDKQKRAEFISHILGVIATSTVIFCLIFVIFRKQLASIVHIDSSLVLIGILVASMSSITTVVLVIFQLEKKAKNYAVFINLKKLVEIGIALLLVVVFGLTWHGTVYGLLISTAIFLCVAFICLRRRDVKLSFPRRKYLGLLLLGAPLAIAHMSAWTNEMVGKLMINSILNVESTGLYSVGYRFGMLIMMVEVALSRAWLPFFYENIRRDDVLSREKIVKATYICMIGLVLLTLVVGCFSKYLLYMMVDPKFYAAAGFILLISIAYCFDGIWKLFLGYLVHNNRTQYYTYIIVASAVLNVVLNYILLHKIGLMGAAWATCASFAFGAFVTMAIAVKVHPMPWLYFLRKKRPSFESAV